MARGLRPLPPASALLSTIRTPLQSPTKRISLTFRQDKDGAALVEVLPIIATMRRLTAAREIILSGFQQDLHATDEVPIAYWYLSRILGTHLECIDQVGAVALQGQFAYHRYIFVSDWYGRISGTRGNGDSAKLPDCTYGHVDSDVCGACVPPSYCGIS